MAENTGTPSAAHEGFLLKKGHRRRNWLRRWFVLEEGGEVKYYEKQDKKVLKGSFSVKGSTFGPATNVKEKYENGLIITCANGTVYLVRADNEEGWLTWKQKFENAGAEWNFIHGVQSKSGNKYTPIEPPWKDADQVVWNQYPLSPFKNEDWKFDSREPRIAFNWNNDTTCQTFVTVNGIPAPSTKNLRYLLYPGDNEISVNLVAVGSVILEKEDFESKGVITRIWDTEVPKLDFIFTLTGETVDITPHHIWGIKYDPEKSDPMDGTTPEGSYQIEKYNEISGEFVVTKKLTDLAKCEPDQALFSLGPVTKTEKEMEMEIPVSWVAVNNGKSKLKKKVTKRFRFSVLEFKRTFTLPKTFQGPPPEIDWRELGQENLSEDDKELFNEVKAKMDQIYKLLQKRDRELIREQLQEDPLLIFQMLDLACGISKLGDKWLSYKPVKLCPFSGTKSIQVLGTDKRLVRSVQPINVEVTTTDPPTPLEFRPVMLKTKNGPLKFCQAPVHHFMPLETWTPLINFMYMEMDF